MSKHGDRIAMPRRERNVKELIVEKELEEIGGR